MPVDPPVTAATSGLVGSIVGALTSSGTTFMAHRLQARSERVSLDLAKREELYGEFIEQVTPLFVDSVENTEFDPAKILPLYSVLGRIRLVSTDEVLREAEEVIANLLKWYSNPVQKVRAVMEQAAVHEVVDPIQPFAQSCRREARRPFPTLVKHSESSSGSARSPSPSRLLSVG